MVTLLHYIGHLGPGAQVAQRHELDLAGRAQYSIAHHSVVHYSIVDYSTLHDSIACYSISYCIIV